MLIEMMAYQHKLTLHCLGETATLKDTSSVFATKHFGENKLEDDLGEELVDKQEDKQEDDMCRTI